MVLTVYQPRGGMSKTTTALALIDGQPNTIGIDFDPQQTLTMLMMKDNNPKWNIESVIRGKCDIVQAVNKTQLGNVIAGSYDITWLSPDEVDDNSWVKNIRELEKHCHCIIFDLGPERNMMTELALMVSDFVIAPVTTNSLMLQCVKNLVESVETIRQTKNSKLAIAGILLTQYRKSEPRHAKARQELKDIASELGVPMFEAVIRDCQKIPEAQDKGISIFHFSPGSSGARDYHGFIAELWKVMYPWK